MVASHLLEDGMLMHLDLEATGLPVKEYVVPRSVVRLALEGAHDCMQHVGVDRTLSALKTARLWWPSRLHDVRKYVLHQCRTCAMNKTGPYVGQMHVPNNGFMPWHTVTVDVVHLEETASGYCAVVVFCCRMTRAVEAAPCSKDLGAEEFINIVTYCLISKGRKPVVLYSDRGSNIIAKLCKAYYAALNINNIPATSRKHTLVAVCERFNGTLRTLARAAYFDTCYQWDALLPIIVLTPLQASGAWLLAVLPRPRAGGVALARRHRGIGWDGCRYVCVRAPPRCASARQACNVGHGIPSV